MDRNPPANAGDTGSIPGLGRFHIRSSQAHALHLEPVLCNERSHCTEKLEHYKEEESPEVQPEKAQVQQ